MQAHALVVLPAVVVPSLESKCRNGHLIPERHQQGGIGGRAHLPYGLFCQRVGFLVFAFHIGRIYRVEEFGWRSLACADTERDAQHKRGAEHAGQTEPEAASLPLLAFHSEGAMAEECRGLLVLLDDATAVHDAESEAFSFLGSTYLPGVIHLAVVEREHIVG